VKPFNEKTLLEPFFLDGDKGKLFTIYFAPESGNPDLGILYVPPFADEMNKSRRQAYELAQRLSSLGASMLVVDLYGTGDSQGDFHDARLGAWLSDLQRGFDWLVSRGVKKVVVLGVRFGGLLAARLAQELDSSVAKLVIWQPVINGSNYINQLLRLRSAADMMAGKGDMSTKALRQKIAEGEVLEIAGYEVHPDLVSGIEKLDLRQLKFDKSILVDWFEVSTNPNYSVGAFAKQAIQSWEDRGATVNVQIVMGELFWSAPETSVVEELVQLTGESVRAIR